MPGSLLLAASTALPIIFNSSICGPAFAVPFAGFLRYGDSYEQDNQIAAIDGKCKMSPHCLFFQCAGFRNRKLVGPPIVICDVKTRRWSEFPRCPIVENQCDGDVSAENDNACWKKKWRWRYDYISNQCQPFETCARNRELGGNATNVFKTMKQCEDKCVATNDSDTSRTDSDIRIPFDHVYIPPTTPAPVKMSPLPESPFIPLALIHSGEKSVDDEDVGKQKGNNASEIESSTDASDAVKFFKSKTPKDEVPSGVEAPSHGGHKAGFEWKCIQNVGLDHTSCLPDSENLIALEEVPVQEIVNVHNKWRRSVSPPAVDMVDLRWDGELALTAERHVSQCKGEHDEEKARALPRWTKVGQNLFQSRFVDRDWTNIIDIWAEGRKGWIYGVGAVNSARLIRQYTQIIWANTFYVG